MRVLVCGGRNFNDKLYLYSIMNIIHSMYNITLLIEGEARGADTLAKQWAIDNNISYIPFPAQWNKYGKSAGYIRNKQMLDEGVPDLVVVFPGGIGTKMMKELSLSYKIEVIEPPYTE